jgi:hypothetical protein
VQIIRDDLAPYTDELAPRRRRWRAHAVVVDWRVLFAVITAVALPWLVFVVANACSGTPSRAAPQLSVAGTLGPDRIACDEDRLSLAVEYPDTVTGAAVAFIDAPSGSLEVVLTADGASYHGIVVIAHGFARAEGFVAKHVALHAGDVVVVRIHGLVSAATLRVLASNRLSSRGEGSCS